MRNYNLNRKTENRTKRDVSFLNLLSDFETNFEKGDMILYDENTYLEIIRFYEEEFQYDKAIEVTDIALNQYAYSADFMIIKARLLFQSNMHKEALILLDEAEKNSPYEHDILVLKIRILAFQGKVEEARDILFEMKRYVTADDLSDIYLSESFLNEYEQNFGEMYDNLCKSVMSDFTNEEALERLGLAVQLCKNFSQSKEFHKAILNENPYNYLAWYNLGQCLICMGDYEEAIAAIEYSFLVEKDFANGYLECADLCIQQKSYRHALTIYESFLDQFGLNEEVLMNMAECHYQLSSLPKAKLLLTKLLKLDPYNDEVHFMLGKCFSKAGRWTKAVNAYHKAIALEENCEEYYSEIAKAHEALGSVLEAEKFYFKCVSLGPEQSQYWTDFVAFMLKKGKISEAQEILNEAENHTFGADLLYCQAISCFQSGQKQAAKNYLEEALIEDYAQHEIIFMINPELALDSELMAMINYYREEQ